MPDELIPVMKPLLPTIDKLTPYISRIDASRYYSNFGPLLVEFEERLGTYFGLPPNNVATVVNGTTALSAALLAMGARPGKKCLLPSWTFVASAAAVWAANLVPHFVDVSSQTWMLDPHELRRRVDLTEVGAVMVVSAFGAPLDTASWDEFTLETGIPVVIDAAAGFDTMVSASAMRPRKAPVMVSFHATKVLGIGEGAVVIADDEALITRVRKNCNFGVWGDPEQQTIGYNGKLSEYHAAVGLASLDAWPQRRAAVEHVTQEYVRQLGQLPGAKVLPGFGDGWVSCYCNVVVEGDAREVAARLKRSGIDTRRWWQSGVHPQRAYEAFPHDDLPVTEDIAGHALALPFYHDLTDAQITRVVANLRAATSPE